MNLYEGMFLLNSIEAKRDWDGMLAHVKGLLTKHGAEVLKDVLWDDRKLAYEVDGQKRGTYLLIYFKMDPTVVAAFRRDCNLDDRIMRQLFVRHEGTEVPVFAAAPEGHGEEIGEPRHERRYGDRRSGRFERGEREKSEEAESLGTVKPDMPESEGAETDAAKE